jgi:hypothetical protein
MMKWGYYYIARTLSFGFACRFMKLRWAARVCYVRQVRSMRGQRKTTYLYPCSKTTYQFDDRRKEH